MEEIIETSEVEEILETEEKTGYKPRPKWQIIAAWVGVAIMVVSVALYYYHIANGGI